MGAAVYKLLKKHPCRSYQISYIEIHFHNISERCIICACKQNTVQELAKGLIFPFSKKGDFRIIKNYKGIALIAIAAKIHNALLLNRIQSQESSSAKSERFSEKLILIIADSDFPSNNRRSKRKKLEAILLFVDFSKAFDSIHRGKVKQILLVYGLFKETVTAIMMLNKNMKAMLCSPDGD